jgi:hypothetical protein
MKEFKNEIKAAVESETAELRSELFSLKDQNSMLHAALQDNQLEIDELEQYGNNITKFRERLSFEARQLVRS